MPFKQGCKNTSQERTQCSGQMNLAREYGLIKTNLNNQSIITTKYAVIRFIGENQCSMTNPWLKILWENYVIFSEICLMHLFNTNKSNSNTILFENRTNEKTTLFDLRSPRPAKPLTPSFPPSPKSTDTTPESRLSYGYRGSTRSSASLTGWCFSEHAALSQQRWG